MSRNRVRKHPYADALGHDSAEVRRRIAEIKRWAAHQPNSFVRDMLTANPRLEWAMPDIGCDPAPADYEVAFGFTTTEAEIAAAFVEGKNVDEIAKERGCSINTVRTHFAHIKDKLGKRKQTEVLRELMKI